MWWISTFKKKKVPSPPSGSNFSVRIWFAMSPSISLSVASLSFFLFKTWAASAHCFTLAANSLLPSSWRTLEFVMRKTCSLLLIGTDWAVFVLKIFEKDWSFQQNPLHKITVKHYWRQNALDLLPVLPNRILRNSMCLKRNVSEFQSIFNLLFKKINEYETPCEYIRRD